MTFDLRTNLENNAFRLVQTKEDHFEELYKLANNPSIWEQHPEKDRWKKNLKIISELLQRIKKVTALLSIKFQINLLDRQGTTRLTKKTDQLELDTLFLLLNMGVLQPTPK